MAGSINIINTSWKDCSRPALSSPAKRTAKQTVTTASLSQKRKAAEDYVKDRIGKYAQYFEKDRIEPIPELGEAMEPKTLSFVIPDLKTRRLASLKKETFEKLLKTTGVPCRYFCRWSFATWDVRLPSEDPAQNTDRGHNNNEVFPASAGIQRLKEN